ncbi:MAG: lytic transglycosylase protein [Solirubrobacterales bacterium]|nr:lytic transglycosylase protein [Solirubrobacterales bacterium]
MSARPANNRTRRPAVAPSATGARAPRAPRVAAAGQKRKPSAPGVKGATQVRAARRRRRRLVLCAVLLGALGAAVILPNLHHAVREITLPLKHEDIIRQQAREKDLDPALIAGVIYAESHFRDGQVSSAGALGLMQLTPETAKDIARRSGGSAFGIKDLGTPQVNISYGAYYLRYLKGRFGGNTALMLAAYNAGEGNVDRWIGEAARAERDFKVGDIPFPETRHYVEKVVAARRDYRANYARELGLG